MPPLRRFAGIAKLVSTHDVCPGFSARVRVVALSPLGALVSAAAVAVLCGLAIHPRVFALAGGLLGVVAVGVCWPWLTARGVRAEVRFDRERVTEGEPAGVAATVTNHLPWPAWGLTVRGGLAAADEVAVRLDAVAGRSRTVCRWTARPGGRGDYPVAVPRLATGFPFGVWEAGRAVRVESRLLVWPRTVPVGPVPAAGGDEQVEGNVARSKVGSTGDVIGVRPYRRGDSPRRIHWSQSAKHDRLVVCELQSRTRPVVLLVLDADPAVHTGGPDGTREWAVRVVASFAKGWLEEGAQVGAAWSDTVLPPAAGPGQLTRILDGLARLPAGPGRPLGELLRAPAVRASRSAVRVVVTSDAGSAGTPNPGGRMVALTRAGFPGTGGLAHEPHPSATCDEGPVRPWLELTGPDRVAHQLRFGWSEARHGS